jgi:aconitate hydratase
MAEFVFDQIDPDYHVRAAAHDGPHVIVGGDNYGQGSSREHAAIAPRYLGLRAVLAKSFARIHWQNLANFGILALEFVDPGDYDRIEPDDVLVVEDLPRRLGEGREIEVRNATQDRTVTVRHRLSPRQVEMVVAGGLIAVHRL